MVKGTVIVMAMVTVVVRENVGVTMMAMNTHVEAIGR